MKTILGFLALSFGLLILASCKKELSTPQKLAPLYYYKILETDLDDSVSTTSIFLVRTTNQIPDAISNTSLVAVDGITPIPICDCKKNPDDVRCKSFPVVLSNISVSYVNGTVTVRWTADIEQNVKDYQIVRSIDQKIWTVVTTIAPKGEGTDYTYEDILD